MFGCISHVCILYEENTSFFYVVEKAMTLDAI